MASADIKMNIQNEDSANIRHDDDTPLIKYYRPSEPLPGQVPEPNNFLRKAPSVLAAVQASSGILSLGIGIVFAVSFKINDFYLTLFRVPIVTGVLFIFAGVLTNLLYKYPALLQACFFVNIGCLAVSGVGAVILSFDLYPGGTSLNFMMETLVLCVTMINVCIAAILICLIYGEKLNHKK